MHPWDIDPLLPVSILGALAAWWCVHGICNWDNEESKLATGSLTDRKQGTNSNQYRPALQSLPGSLQCWHISSGSNLRAGSGLGRGAQLDVQTGVTLLLSKTQRVFAHKLLLPKARLSGFRSQMKQRGMKPEAVEYKIWEREKRETCDKWPFFFFFLKEVRCSLGAS